jgi:hypothetical protein
MVQIGGRDGSRTIARIADRILPAWFLLWSLVRVEQLGWNGVSWDLSFIGRDFAIYRNAAIALLKDGDPWSASAPWNGTDWHFAAPPTSAQLFVPSTWVGSAVAWPIFAVISVAVASLALRRLSLPIWWLLFPPMAEGLVAGNPQILVFGLLVLGSTTRRGRLVEATKTAIAAQAIAVGLKVYGIVPILARREWRAVAGSIGLVAVSIVVAPGVWQHYVASFTSISGRVVAESNGGLSAALFLQPRIFGTALPSSESLRLAAGLLMYGLIVALVLIVALRDLRAAGWLAAPLLWPAAEYHLATMAIPIARRWSTWLIAIPTLPTYLFGLIILSYEVTARRSMLGATGATRDEPEMPLDRRTAQGLATDGEMVGP